MIPSRRDDLEKKFWAETHKAEMTTRKGSLLCTACTDKCCLTRIDPMSILSSDSL